MKRSIPLFLASLTAAMAAAGGCRSESSQTGPDTAAQDAAAEALADGPIPADLSAGELDTHLVPPDLVGPAETLAEGARMETAADAAAFSCAEPNGAGCPCQDGSDCSSGFCVFHAGEKVCTYECIEDCPTGWTCTEMTGFGTDTVFLCASNAPALCLPCVHSNECASGGGKCVPYQGGSGAFCGSPCEATAECPPGYECTPGLTAEGETAKQCIRDAGECACSTYAERTGLGTWCTASNDWGSCQAWRSCSESGLGPCTAATPAAEVCFNTADEDCDGQFDDPDVCCGCEGKVCGDDGCGDPCGDCPLNHVCTDAGACVCVPACADKVCGPDGCGGTCGQCPVGAKCLEEFGECQIGCDADKDCAVLEECVGGICQPDVPDDAQLLPPTTLETVPGQASAALFARVFEAGLTEAAGAPPALQAEVGSGPANTDPQTQPMMWSWQKADYLKQDGTFDVWTATLAGAAPGAYLFTFRFSLDGDHWVYADSTGLDDGFEPAELGSWTVPAGPKIDAVVPDHGTVLGGETVQIHGSGFAEGLTLAMAGEPIALLNVEEGLLTFVAPQHPAGPVSLEVENPNGQKTSKEGAFQYVLRFTPTLDGQGDEWDQLFKVAAGDVASNWDPVLNHLDSLFAAFDDQYLYVAVAGTCETQNYLLGYLDADFGAASGVVNMIDLSDNDGNGDLDDALSNVLTVSIPGFGADVGFGTKGMASFVMGDKLDNALLVGWRKLGPPYNLAWLQGTVKAGTGFVEAAVPLSTLIPGTLPAGGQEVALFVQLTDRYGDVPGISNQALPGHPDTPGLDPKKITQAAVVKVLP
jgi:hypothetical protein